MTAEYQPQRLTWWEWAIAIVLLAAFACALCSAFGCAEVPRANAPPDATGDEATTWVLGVPAWIASIGNWLWSGLLAWLGITAVPSGDWLARLGGWIGSHPVVDALIGNATLAAFPNKVQDGVVTAVNPKSGATPVERVLALAAATPLGFFFHSPPPVKKRQQVRKAKKGNP